MTSLFVHVYANQLNSLLVQYSIIKVRCNSKHCVASCILVINHEWYIVHTLCGHLEVVLLARHNWTGNKGGALKALPSIQSTMYVPRFHSIEFQNPSTTLILKEHAEMHARNSVSERSGGGGRREGGQFSHHARAKCKCFVALSC